jgi:hypothetical protein
MLRGLVGRRGWPRSSLKLGFSSSAELEALNQQLDLANPQSPIVDILKAKVPRADCSVGCNFSLFFVLL